MYRRNLIKGDFVILLAYIDDAFHVINYSFSIQFYEMQSIVEFTYVLFFIPSTTLHKIDLDYPGKLFLYIKRFRINVIALSL